ncbi:SRPBCC family protein [Streptomyces yaanensis]|uniref:SRPBCC family protein n=1 Tax=Streptomyces yaanensis TaxID=1142239 RepID=A0ABV7SIL0_9ACTN|nr:SRPBCC family protein [Streptomyces sp. CGMCC 4.7035]WNB97849.1 SRPBCC family protein [Streptomyces sp. CGMCC 4.7035]
MSTLEEHVDVGVPIDRAWDRLHRVENFPSFVEGVRDARTEPNGRAHLDVEAGGRTRELEAEVSDRKERVMEWHTTGAPLLAGTFSLKPIDRTHTRVQARLEYDPDTVRETFGGPKGFAQANAIERVVRSDLEHFKDYLERER